MKITRVEVLHFSRQLDGRAWNPAFRWNERQAPLLVIECDHIFQGIGEAWAGYGSVQETLEILSNEVAPRLLGFEFFATADIGGLTHDKSEYCESKARCAAWSAADIALWDVFSRAIGQPLWKMLQGESSQAKVYASGGLYRDDYSLEELAAETAGYRARGFDSMKMKVAGLSPAQDLERVVTVREALGANGDLWIDGVNQWRVPDAIAFWKLVENSRVQAVQSPIPADDVSGLAALNADIFPVIAAEAEYRQPVLQGLLDAGAVTYLQFCLPLCGGFTGAKRLDEMAARYGVKTTPQCFSTVIAQAAVLHFAAASSNVVAAEYHCFHDHLAHLFIGDAGKVHQGYACAGNAPGLSVSIPALGTQADGSVITRIAEIR